MADRKPDWARAKKMAKQVLQENFVTEPPVRVDQIAPNYGLRVFEVAFPAEHQDVAGIISIDDAQILVNSEDPATRQAFTIAHELGHWIMHMDELRSNPGRSVLLRRPLGKADPDPLEQEANCFAAHLLVPDHMLKMYKGQDVDLLARAFGVSREVMGYSLAR